ncbi:MAG: hypothetical protein WKF57_06515 [Nakamurella sp.]
MKKLVHKAADDRAVRLVQMLNTSLTDMRAYRSMLGGFLNEEPAVLNAIVKSACGSFGNFKPGGLFPQELREMAMTSLWKLIETIRTGSESETVTFTEGFNGYAIQYTAPILALTFEQEFVPTGRSAARRKQMQMRNTANRMAVELGRMPSAHEVSMRTNDDLIIGRGFTPASPRMARTADLVGDEQLIRSAHDTFAARLGPAGALKLAGRRKRVGEANAEPAQSIGVERTCCESEMARLSDLDPWHAPTMLAEAAELAVAVRDHAAANPGLRLRTDQQMVAAFNIACVREEGQRAAVTSGAWTTPADYTAEINELVSENLTLDIAPVHGQLIAHNEDRSMINQMMSAVREQYPLELHEAVDHIMDHLSSGDKTITRRGELARSLSMSLSEFMTLCEHVKQTCREIFASLVD